MEISQSLNPFLYSTKGPVSCGIMKQIRSDVGSPAVTLAQLAEYSDAFRSPAALCLAYMQYKGVDEIAALARRSCNDCLSEIMRYEIRA
jgi:hypothetical protein